MKHRSKLKEPDRHYLAPGYLKPYLDKFITELSKKGYAELTIKSYYDSAAHFATWLQQKNIALENVTINAINNFSNHRCNCIPNRRTGRLSHQYTNRVRRFICYLYNEGTILFNINIIKPPLPPILVKFKESLQYRGLSNRTIDTYEYSINKFFPLLNKNPQKYNANHIREVIFETSKKNSLCAVKKLTTALKCYLRFLATEGMCSPDLDAAVPTVAQWKLSSLPKYITPDELEKIINSCDIYTQQGLRDRAIILLLARLGLRAGDVSNMRIDDIDWVEGTLRVSGKGRREILLPLPQEVGNALLDYINKARPAVIFDQLFLCLNAPYRPFPSSSGISSVVSAALARADIKDPPSHGANLLRHTAATNMLRKGATLEAVSAMLRHRSLDMTVYYAKVDIPRLKKIAQPWPEGAPYAK